MENLGPLYNSHVQVKLKDAEEFVDDLETP